jgi:V8-like Glu-specific endopeptidase
VSRFQFRGGRSIFHLAFALIVAATAAIYGPDDRREVLDVARASRLAPAIAVSVPEIYFIKKSTPAAIVPDAMKDFGLCSTERFLDQFSMGLCTGFLVAPRILVTAGHCQGNMGINRLSDQYCAAFLWVFDYNLKGGNSYNYDSIPADKIYRCVRSIHNEVLENYPYNLARVGELTDFSVIELDRDVEGVEPLRLGTSPRQNVGMVFTIGHPWGLPAKYSGMAKVGHSHFSVSFSSTLDTLRGNSGGPVFNEQSEVVGILMAGHQNDDDDGKAQCTSINRCDEQAQNCTVKSQLFPFSEIQRIESVLPYLPVRSEARFSRNSY